MQTATSGSATSGIAFTAGMVKMPDNMAQATPEQNSPSKTETFETRFGSVEIETSNPLTFEHGLLGMPENRQFVLAPFPNPKLGQFLLLQSLEDKSLSFIVLPLPAEGGIIERPELEQAAADIGFTTETLMAYLIVSVHRTPTEVQISVNARAPLIVDTASRKASQYVFQHSRYKVQHFLATP